MQELGDSLYMSDAPCGVWLMQYDWCNIYMSGHFFVSKNKIIIVIFCLNFPASNQNVFNLLFFYQFK